MRKLNYLRASYFMAMRFKDLRSGIQRLTKQRNFAGVLQLQVNHLRTLQEAGSLKQLQSHIAYLGKIYQKGNSYVQYIIENLFVRSLKSLEKNSRVGEWERIYAQLPPSFASLYDKLYVNLQNQKLGL